MAEMATGLDTRGDKQRTLKLLKPFVCRNCHALFGVTDGDALRLGGAFIVGRAVLKCACCGAIRVWRPLKEKESR